MRPQAKEVPPLHAQRYDHQAQWSARAAAGRADQHLSARARQNHRRVGARYASSCLSASSSPADRVEASARIHRVDPVRKRIRGRSGPRACLHRPRRFRRAVPGHPADCSAPVSGSAVSSMTISRPIDTAADDVMANVPRCRCRTMRMLRRRITWREDSDELRGGHRQQVSSCAAPGRRIQDRRPAHRPKVRRGDLLATSGGKMTIWWADSSVPAGGARCAGHAQHWWSPIVARVDGDALSRPSDTRPIRWRISGARQDHLRISRSR